MNNSLEKRLGKVLSPSQVADYLGVDIRTVRKYYKDIGGLRLGRCLLFFEKKIVSIVEKNYALQTSEQVYRLREEEGLSTSAQNFSEKEGRKKLGDRDREELVLMQTGDPHGIFNQDVGK